MLSAANGEERPRRQTPYRIASTWTSVAFATCPIVRAIWPASFRSRSIHPVLGYRVKVSKRQTFAKDELSQVQPALPRDPESDARLSQRWPRLAPPADRERWLAASALRASASDGDRGPNTASFAYDPLGRRAQRTISGTSTQFLYDGSNPAQEIQNGAPSANVLTGLGIDEFFQRVDSGGTSDYLSDILGSTIALIGTSGSIQTQYTYSPFGNLSASGTASSNPYQFTGRENDAIGLDYYRARYYSPSFAQFVAQDPLEFGGSGPNLYAYVSNDPVDYTDPFGLYSCHYSISAHTMVCIPNDPNDPKFDSSNFASGAPGSCRNNLKCSDSKNVGPITPHDYYIGPNVGGRKMGGICSRLADFPTAGEASSYISGARTGDAL
jgi:RHS repeat-associated protein